MRFRIPRVTREMIDKANKETADKIEALKLERINNLRIKEQKRLDERLAIAEENIRNYKPKPKKHVNRARSNASKESHITRKKRIVLHYLSRDLTIDEARKMANLSKFEFKKMLKDDLQFAQECRCTKLVELESYIEKVIGDTMESDASLLDSKKYSDYVAEKKLRATMQIEKIRYMKEELKHERTLDLLEKDYKDINIEVEI